MHSLSYINDSTSRLFQVCDWQFVVNHMQDDDTLPCQNGVQALHDEVYPCNSPENGNTNLTEKQQQEEDDIQHVRNV